MQQSTPKGENHVSSITYNNDAVLALIPLGHLRASINLGNPILANQDPITGMPVGVSVDLAQGLANSLGVDLELVMVDSAKKSVENISNNRVDIGFVAIDPLRATALAFTKPYVLIQGAYLVKESSPVQRLDEVDQENQTVVVGGGSAYDLYLTRELKNAHIVRAATSPTVVDTFLEGIYDVAAGVRQQLEADAARLGGLRILPGNFMQIAQAMATPKTRGNAAVALLMDYIQSQKACGFISASLARHEIQGAAVAPQ